jgi:uncharacterized oxidoreductase
MAGDGGTVVCGAAPLEAFVRAVVGRMGADAEAAAEVARHLVRANLSGHDSHGVLRLPQYLDEADRGDLVPGARPSLAVRSEVAALVDAGRCFGHVSTMLAMRWAIERAPRQGVAVVAVRRTTHIGRLGEYTEAAAEAGLVGLVTVGLAGPGLGGMVPFGGRERFLGTNPWSIAVPGAPGRLVFDGATSTVAEGKVRVARAKGRPLPDGCLQDRDGRATRDPEALYAGGALLPLGGASAGHKGYGLALASALVAGLGLAADPAPPPGRVDGVFVQAIDPACFGDAGHYRALVEGTLAAARRVAPAEGRTAVLVPGDPEAAERAARERDGIPLPAPTWADLGRVAGRLGVEMPPARPLA